MKKNLEKRLNALGYRLIPKLYQWSQWKIVVGPEYPAFARYFDTLKEVETFVQDEEGPAKFSS
jgi:hypothetical protein